MINKITHTEKTILHSPDFTSTFFTVRIVTLHNAMNDAVQAGSTPARSHDCRAHRGLFLESDLVARSRDQEGWDFFMLSKPTFKKFGPLRNTSSVFFGFEFAYLPLVAVVLYRGISYSWDLRKAFGVRHHALKIH